ncbi:MAG: DUF1549 domain-containing protein [Bryobacteraceae bacterium]
MTARDGYANTWRYRDWVIDAFNQDMPHDSFVKAQIAADLLPDKDKETLLPDSGSLAWVRGSRETMSCSSKLAPMSATTRSTPFPSLSLRYSRIHGFDDHRGCRDACR